MKTMLFILLGVLMLAFSHSAWAGDAFYISYQLSKGVSVPINVNYSANSSCWYQKDLPSQISMQGAQQTKPFYTETKASGSCAFSTNATLAIRLTALSNGNPQTTCYFGQTSTGCGTNSGCLVGGCLLESTNPKFVLFMNIVHTGHKNHFKIVVKKLL